MRVKAHSRLNEIEICVYTALCAAQHKICAVHMQIYVVNVKMEEGTDAQVVHDVTCF